MTWLEGVKPLPSTVTVVPPPVGPVLSLRLVTDGTGAAGSFGQASVIVSPTWGGGIGYGPTVAVDWAGFPAAVQPGAVACTS
jgi:hypothetical protein